MTLKEKVKELFGNRVKDKFIGIYETDENGEIKPIHPDYMDEILETHGDLQIEDTDYLEEKKILVVEFKENL